MNAITQLYSKTRIRETTVEAAQKFAFVLSLLKTFHVQFASSFSSCELLRYGWWVYFFV
jgi:hypothetical protein